MLYGHNQDIDIKFYNDRIKEQIAAEAIAIPFTYVPIKAGHMELISGNAVVFGKITEGYDTIKPDMSVDVDYSDISVDFTTINLDVYISQRKPPYSWDPTPGGEITRNTRFYVSAHVLIPNPVTSGDVYYLRVDDTKNDIAYIVSYVAQAGDNWYDVTVGLNAAMLAHPNWGPSRVTSDADPVVYPFWLDFWPLDRVYHTFPPPSEGNFTDVFPDYGYEVSAYYTSYGTVTKYPVLKYGAVHGFGLVYKDEIARRCSVIKTDDFDIYLPWYMKGNPNGLPDVLTTTIAYLTFNINHRPPDWATTYEIVYSGNISMDYFLQIRINDIKDLTHDRWAVMIQDTLDETRINNLRWKVPDYIWEHGDRLRLIGTIDTGSGDVTEFEENFDYEIERTSTMYGDAVGGEWLIVQAVNAPTEWVEGANDILVEVYRPRKGLGTTIFYGTGMVFEIGIDANGNKYHKGDIDQVIDLYGNTTTKAQIFNTANDCWKYFRLNYESGTVNVVPFYAESIAPSDWWDLQTALTSQGWPFLWDVSQQQVALHERIRNGGRLLEGTQVNNIALFMYNDFVDLPRKNGDITALREIGFTLKVLQMYKETSIYINRVQTFSADGGLSNYTLVQNLLGTSREESTNYGCQHPDSVLVNDRNLYYWDNSEGKYIRSAPNGQLPISDYKMKRWFRDLSAWITLQGGSRLLLVNSGANVEHNEIWVNWNMNGVVWGAIFSEHHGRWITRIDQQTESYVHLGIWFAHMYRQKLYIMNVDEGQGWLEWAKVPTVGDVQFVSNVNPEKNKVFNSLAVYADHQFDCNSRYILIPYEASYVLMETYVAVWNKSEGIYYGRILKDENSPGNFATMNARTMNGREIRGRYCYVRLRTEEHDEKVRIYSVIVLSTDSERSG